MRNELHAFKKAAATNDSPLVGIESYQATLLDAENMLILALSNLFYRKNKTSDISRIILHLQQFCIRRLDEIDAEIEIISQAAPYLKVEQATLQRMLRLLWIDYPSLFKHAHKAPACWYVTTFAKLLERKNLLEALLKKRKVTVALQEVLLSIFSNRDGLEDYSFHQLVYLEFLQDSLIRFCQQVTIKDINPLVLEHLIYLNFNHNGFIGYVKGILEEEFIAVYSDKAQYELICQREKQLFALPIHDKYVFNQDMNSCHSQLLNYVTAAVVCFHRKADLSAMGKHVVATGPMEQYRVKVNLSASGLAYLIRLLIETGVIDGNPRTKVLQFFAANFQTSGIGDGILSVNSMATKYKQVVQSTAKNLRSVLKTMTKVVEENFDL